MGIQLYNKVPVNTIKLIKYKPFKGNKNLV